ncbi:UNVERIFIED_CONTAM: hypothetical protein PYX00_011918 [Menopon gallinae]|uniref:ABC transporter domain-containing protein n=1 Tax=Menopon gallinae TaxID=328185 RepID=A0AAW2H913_9NEOP
MRHITKRFGCLTVNNAINLNLRQGEVHAILGENGAGKTTLMKILYGEYKPNEGEIYLRGKKVQIKSPRDAIAEGIGMVHQHFMLVDNLSVLENLLLGCEKTFMGFIRIQEHEKELKLLIDQYGFDIDLYAKVSSISIGMQQRVEILKTLYHGAQILILDEPTAVLTPQEIQGLVEIVYRLKREGKSILLITHKLREIKEMADRCTIIRRGKVIDVVNVKKVLEKDLAYKMVGRVVSFDFPSACVTQEQETLLNIENLSVFDEEKRVAKLDHFSLQLKSGEILGLAGVDGNGQTELMEALVGIRSYSGEVFFKGQSLRHKSPKEIFDLGISNIPQDRHKEGLILEYDIKRNLVLRNYTQKPFSHAGVLNFSAMEEQAVRLQEAFDVRPRDPNILASQISGGNQQKVIIAREVSAKHQVLLAAHPTRGLDVGAIQYIYKALVKERDKGKGIFLISFELEELLSICDRIAVIFQGKIMDIVSKEEADEEKIGLLMMGHNINKKQKQGLKI